MAAACAALDRAYRYLLAHGGLIGATHETFNMQQLHELSGVPDVWEFERRHLEV